jgi:hypothetical protein
MATEYTVRVHFIDGSERIVPAINIHDIGDEGAKSATALVDGREVPIYNKPEWGFLWYEQKEEESERTVNMEDVTLSQEDVAELLTVLNVALYDSETAKRISRDLEMLDTIEEHRKSLRKWIHRLSQQTGNGE